MKTLFIDCGMGAAGDMLTAALLELLPEPGKMVDRWNELGIPGVHYARETAVKCGITGTHVSVTVQGQEESCDHLHSYGQGHEKECQYQHQHEHENAHEHKQEHEHENHQEHKQEHEHENNHEHHHQHHHEHTHSSLHHIEHMVREHLSVSAKVKEDVLAVYGLIAQAESKVHGVPITEIHFHEVGTMDALADITAVCMLMEELAPEQVVVSPIHVGSGQVRCAHGILPVPAPATAQILRDVPIYGGRVQGELCTPTGAALLKYFATRFGEMPVMTVGAVGYGMGKKDFEAANCVRVLLGETAEQGDTVVELSCNMDDMTAEALGYATEALFAAGALEVYTVPVGMKKSRPGTLLCTMCRMEDKEKMIRLIFRHTTTIGIREQVSRRYKLERRVETVETAYGAVRKKISSGYEIQREKYEYEDIAEIARKEGLGLSEVLARL